MLIDRIMYFCDNEYQRMNMNFRCTDCEREDGCSGGCKNCLEEIHYPSRHPNGKRNYDCPHLINFYVCDYTYKYTTEMHLLMQKSTVLRRLPHYNVFSIGCGGCPDLMAFELYIQDNNFSKTVEYRGMIKTHCGNPCMVRYVNIVNMIRIQLPTLTYQQRMYLTFWSIFL